jgi:hypothetical protein
MCGRHQMNKPPSPCPALAVRQQCTGVRGKRRRLFSRAPLPLRSLWLPAKLFPRHPSGRCIRPHRRRLSATASERSPARSVGRGLEAAGPRAGTIKKAGRARLTVRTPHSNARARPPRCLCTPVPPDTVMAACASSSRIEKLLLVAGVHPRAASSRAALTISPATCRNRAGS